MFVCVYKSYVVSSKLKFFALLKTPLEKIKEQDEYLETITIIISFHMYSTYLHTPVLCI